MEVATQFQATPLFSMRTLLLAPSQSVFSVDADAWFKRVLTTRTKLFNVTKLFKIAVNDLVQRNLLNVNGYS